MTPLAAVPFDAAPRAAAAALLRELAEQLAAGELEGILVVMRARGGVSWKSAGITNGDAVFGAMVAVGELTRSDF